MVGRYEVEADAGDGEAGEHDGACGVGGEGGHGDVAPRGVHGAVDAGEGVVVCC